MDPTIANWPILVPALIVTGLFAGTLAGLLGVGGGIVIVPVLYYLFDFLNVDPAVRMHLAVGTSLATIVPTSVRSVLAHRARGSVDMGLLRRWSLPMLAGVLVGTALATQAPAAVLTSIFASVAFVVAFQMAFATGRWRLAEDLPRGPASLGIPAGIGGVSAMMGIGGGTLSVPTLTLFNFPIHRAVGTAAGFGLVIGIPGAIGFVVSGIGAEGLAPFPWTLGYVSLPGFVLIVPATVLAAPWGAKLAHWLSQKALRRAFALFLFVTALRMIADIAGLF